VVLAARLGWFWLNLFARSADGPSALSAKREQVFSLNLRETFAPYGAVRTGRPRSQH